MTTPSGDFDMQTLMALANEHNVRNSQSFELLLDLLALIDYQERKKQKNKGAETEQGDGK